MGLLDKFSPGSTEHTGSSGTSHGGFGRSFTDSAASGASSFPSTGVNSAYSASVFGGYDAYLDFLREISRENNQFNLEQTKMVNDFNAAEAQKNRDWQERLSNTAHQREISDLMKSGLNPVLSAMNGQGAFTGSGAQASGQKAIADNTLANGAISLMSSMLNAQSALTVANIHAGASMYSSDRYAASQSAYQAMMKEHYGNLATHYENQDKANWFGRLVQGLVGLAKFAK